MPLMAPASKNQQACEPLQPVCSILTRGRRPGDFSCGRGGGGYGRRPESRPRCGCPCCRLSAHPLEDGQCHLVPSSSSQKQDRPVGLNYLLQEIVTSRTSLFRFQRGVFGKSVYGRLEAPSPDEGYGKPRGQGWAPRGSRWPGGPTS